MVTAAEELAPHLEVDDWLKWWMIAGAAGQLLPVWMSLRLHDYGFALLYIITGLSGSATAILRTHTMETFLGETLATWDDIEIMFSRWIGVFLLFKTFHFRNQNTFIQTYTIVSVVTVFTSYTGDRLSREIVTQVIWGLTILLTQISIIIGMRVIWINSFILFPIYFVLLCITAAVPYAWYRREEQFYFALSRAVWYSTIPVIGYLITATFWLKVIDPEDRQEIEELRRDARRWSSTEPVVIRVKQKAFDQFDAQFAIPYCKRVLNLLFPTAFLRYLQPDRPGYNPVPTAFPTSLATQPAMVNELFPPAAAWGNSPPAPHAAWPPPAGAMHKKNDDPQEPLRPGRPPHPSMLFPGSFSSPETPPAAILGSLPTAAANQQTIAGIINRHLWPGPS